MSAYFKKFNNEALSRNRQAGKKSGNQNLKEISDNAEIGISKWYIFLIKGISGNGKKKTSWETTIPFPVYKSFWQKFYGLLEAAVKLETKDFFSD